MAYIDGTWPVQAEVLHASNYIRLLCLISNYKTLHISTLIFQYSFQNKTCGSQSTMLFHSMSQTDRFNGFKYFPHSCIYICIQWWNHRSESLAGRELRSGMSYRKWSRIRLPVRPIAPVGVGTAGCYGAQGDDNTKERGALYSAFRTHTAVLNWHHWLYQASYYAGLWPVQWIPPPLRDFGQ